jgi:hypothetical protein
MVVHLNVDSTKMLWATAVTMVIALLGYVGLLVARNWRRIRFE